MKHSLPLSSPICKLLLLAAGFISHLASQAQTCTGTDAYGVAAQQGLVAEYYKGYFADQASFFTNNASFPLKSTQNPAYVERVESTPAYASNDAWSTSGLSLTTAGAAAGSDAAPTQFSARYRGQIYIATAGSYTFYLNSDDASYLAIDNNATPQVLSSYLISNGGAHSAKTVSGTTTLSVGWHSLVILYGNNGGDSRLSLQYSATALGISQQSVPNNILCTGIVSVPTGLAYSPANTTYTAGGTSTSVAPSAYTGNQEVTSYAIANAGNLPAGITIEATTGILTADATVSPGSYVVSVSATNASGAAAFPSVYTFYVNTACTGADGNGKAAQTGLYSEFYAGYFGSTATNTADTDANLAYFNKNAPKLKTTLTTLNVNANSAWSGTYKLNLYTAGIAGGSDAQPAQFSARFRGQLTITTAGDYTFYLTSDDASYLFLDAAARAYAPTVSSATINNGPAHSKALKQATVTLAAGSHDLLLLYGNGVTNSYLSLEYSGPSGSGISQQIIPSTMLCSTTQTNSQPLPVTLVRFGGQALGAAVRLSWETASELNSAAFEVERSATGTDFAKLGQVAAAGNSAAAQHYQFIDSAPLPGLSYYRLRQVDRDGTTHYSPITVVQRSLGIAPALTVAPNPTTGRVAVQLVQAAAQPAMLQVLDALGHEVHRQELPAASTQEQALDLRALPAGVYLVRVVAATGVAVQRLVRQ